MIMDTMSLLQKLSMQNGNIIYYNFYTCVGQKNMHPNMPPNMRPNFMGGHQGMQGMPLMPPMGFSPNMPPPGFPPPPPGSHFDGRSNQSGPRNMVSRFGYSIAFLCFCVVHF